MDILNKIRLAFSDPLYQVAFILFFFEAVFVPGVSMYPDTIAYCTWAGYICDHGIGYIYQIKNPDFNYPPVLGYLLLTFAKYQGAVDKICPYFRFFKLYGLLADFTCTLVLVRLLNDKKKEIIWLFLLAANAVFVYDSYCWGQSDGILSVFVFVTFILLLKDRLLWATFFFTLALNFKFHAIIFLPPALLTAFIYSRQREIAKSVLSALAVFAFTELAILFPFILAGQLHAVFKAAFGSVNYYDCISCNASNIWVLFFGRDFCGTSDKQTWLTITYQKWGVLMFCVFSGLSLFPLAWSVLISIIKKTVYQPKLTDLFLAFALIPLIFFFFNTQMHERFGHTTLIFTSAFAFATRKYWLYALVFLAYFGNMEGILHFFNFPNYYVLIFHPRWVAAVYLLVLVSLLYFLYSSFIAQLKANRTQQIAQT